MNHRYKLTPQEIPIPCQAIRIGDVVDFTLYGYERSIGIIDSIDNNSFSVIRFSPWGFSEKRIPNLIRSLYREQNFVLNRCRLYILESEKTHIRKRKEWWLALEIDSKYLTSEFQGIRKFVKRGLEKKIKSRKEEKWNYWDIWWAGYDAFSSDNHICPYTSKRKINLWREGFETAQADKGNA